jgi:hypothetical protein
MRVTEAQVLAIFRSDMTEAQITPHIQSANTLIGAYDDLADLSEAVLTEIELWLSAHFASAYDQRISYQSFSESKAKFQGEYKLGLYGTDYGQRAIALDSTGTLQDLADGIKVARIEAFGVNYPTEYAEVDI